MFKLCGATIDECGSSAPCHVRLCVLCTACRAISPDTAHTSVISPTGVKRCGTASPGMRPIVRSRTIMSSCAHGTLYRQRCRPVHEQHTPHQRQRQNNATDETFPGLSQLYKKTLKVCSRPSGSHLDTSGVDAIKDGFELHCAGQPEIPTQSAQPNVNNMLICFSYERTIANSWLSASNTGSLL